LFYVYEDCQWDAIEIWEEIDVTKLTLEAKWAAVGDFKYLKNFCFKDENNKVKSDLYPCTSFGHTGRKYEGKHLIKILTEGDYSSAIALENEDWKVQVKAFVKCLKN